MAVAASSKVAKATSSPPQQEAQEQPSEEREATHKGLLLAWWLCLPLTWAFYAILAVETVTLPLSMFLRYLKVLPPLFTTYAGSDWVYGPSGYIVLDRSGQPVLWYWLYLFHHPAVLVLASIIMARVRALADPVLYALLMPFLAGHPNGPSVWSVIGQCFTLLGIWILPHYLGAVLRRHMLKWKVVTHAAFQKDRSSRAIISLGRVMMVYGLVMMVGSFLVSMLIKLGAVTIVYRSQGLGTLVVVVVVGCQVVGTRGRTSSLIVPIKVAVGRSLPGPRSSMSSSMTRRRRSTQTSSCK